MPLKLLSLSSEMDPAEILGAFDRYLSMREAPRFFLENMLFPHSCKFVQIRGSAQVGMDLFVYLKIVNIVVSIKTRDLAPPLRKAR